MRKRLAAFGAAIVVVLSAALLLAGGLVGAQGDLWPTEEEICVQCAEIPTDAQFPSGTGVGSNASFVCNEADQSVALWIRPWIVDPPPGHYASVALLVLEPGECKNLEVVEGFECSSRPHWEAPWNDQVKGLCWVIGTQGEVVFYEHDTLDPDEAWTFVIPDSEGLEPVDICHQCVEFEHDVPGAPQFPSGTGVWSNSSAICNQTDAAIGVWIRPWIQEPQGHHANVAILVLEPGECKNLEAVEGFECPGVPIGTEPWNDQVKGLCWVKGTSGEVWFFEHDTPDPEDRWIFTIPEEPPLTNTPTPTGTTAPTSTPTSTPTTTLTPTPEVGAVLEISYSEIGRKVSLAGVEVTAVVTVTWGLPHGTVIDRVEAGETKEGRWPEEPGEEVGLDIKTSWGLSLEGTAKLHDRVYKLYLPIVLKF
jgi:hypothetical protein